LFLISSAARCAPSDSVATMYVDTAMIFENSSGTSGPRYTFPHSTAYRARTSPCSVRIETRSLEEPFALDRVHESARDCSKMRTPSRSAAAASPNV